MQDALSTIQMKLGHKLLLDRRVPEQDYAAWQQDYEGSTIAFCIELMRRGAVMIDIGANIGFYTCAIATRLRDSIERIHAFEPVAQNCARLTENLCLNGIEHKVALTRLALGDTRGALELHYPPEGSGNNAVGDIALSQLDRDDIAQKGWQHETAAMVRLDDLLPAPLLPRCDLLKIDIEGADLLALRGGQELIRRCRPVIVAEFNPYWIKQIGLPFPRVIEFAEELDYAIYRELDGALHPLTPELVATGMDLPSYVLTPREKADAVEAAYVRSGGSLAGAQSR